MLLSFFDVFFLLFNGGQFHTAMFLSSKFWVADQHSESWSGLRVLEKALKLVCGSRFTAQPPPPIERPGTGFVAGASWFRIYNMR